MSSDANSLNEREIQADLKAVLISLSGGQPLDPQTARRIRDRADQITVPFIVSLSSLP